MLFRPLIWGYHKNKTTLPPLGMNFKTHLTKQIFSWPYCVWYQWFICYITHKDIYIGVNIMSHYVLIPLKTSITYVYQNICLYFKLTIFASYNHVLLEPTYTLNIQWKVNIADMGMQLLFGHLYESIVRMKHCCTIDLFFYLGTSFETHLAKTILSQTYCVWYQ